MHLGRRITRRVVEHSARLAIAAVALVISDVWPVVEPRPYRIG